MQNSDEFSMDKTSNETTPLLHGNGKATTPKIENSHTGIYFCLIGFKQLFIYIYIYIYIHYIPSARAKQNRNVCNLKRWYIS